ncbi:putative developmental regulator [Phaeomoniella chlamydospora]|uniref:Putative developmental regulator n=1 Tax=Phaeomoniella chlamydospora TaxID=158046 RepID=A0A0G2EJ64_PHACM|nr:putative developmental regulator [Phaeomoniella chlamydospora]
MPVYILHGFRWPRDGLTGIRVHIIVHNVEDAAAEYVQSPGSQRSLLESFQKAHPDIMASLPKDGITFVEQYDPDDVMSTNAVSQPFAYVADKVVTMAAPDEAPFTPTSPHSSKSGSKAGSEKIKSTSLGVNVEDVIAEGSGLSAKGWEAFADLRDAIAPGEKIGWWIVYNGDPERRDGLSDEEDEYDDEYLEEEYEEKSAVQTHKGPDEQTLTALPHVPGPRAKRPPKPEIEPPPTEPFLQPAPQMGARKAAPPPPTKPKLKQTPLEDQKSPLRDVPRDSISRDPHTSSKEDGEIGSEAKNASQVGNNKEDVWKEDDLLTILSSLPL